MSQAYETSGKSDRVKAESQDLCAVCQQMVWVSFYFDAFGHHKDRDGEHISNIGKLWMSSLDKREKGIFSNYYPGLATPFNPELAVLATIAASKTAEKVKEAETGVAKNAAKNTGKQVAKEALAGNPGWWQRVRRLVAHDIKKLGYDYKSQTDIVFHDTARNRYLRGVQRYWKNFAEDLLHHPQRAVGIIKTELFKFGAKLGSEISFIRDTGWAAALFNTGVDTRLEAAKTDFKREVYQTLQLGDIKHINVAVFGADMGGALAIAFVNQLLKDECKNGKFNGIPVNIRFMGLLDCVSARYDDNFLTGFIPLSNAVSGDLKIPKAAERVVHYAAAHEQRLYKPLSTIGGTRAPGGRLEERLFPGAQEDVIGGYANREQGVSNQLSRMPLQMMPNRAWRNGVPVIPLDNMPTKDLGTYTLFEMDIAIRDQVYSYWSKALALSSTTQLIEHPGTPLFTDGKLNMSALTSAAPKPDYLHKLPADIQAELPGHLALYISWLKHWVETHPAKSGQRVSLDILKVDVESMLRRSKLSPLDPAALSAAEKSLLALWQGNATSVLGDSSQLFDHYVHDSLADNGVARVAAGLFNCINYLGHRTILPLEQEPDKSYIVKFIDGVKGGAKIVGNSIVDVVNPSAN